MDIELSVVIPVYNEEENLPILYERLFKVLYALKTSFEVIMVDDGSKDKSYEIMLKGKNTYPELKLIKLRKNFGQHCATYAGFDSAKGNIVVTLDSDLQNDPEDIPRLVQKIKEGYDVVSGWRTDRKDSLLRRKIPSKIINKFLVRNIGFEMHDMGCFLKAYTKEAAKEIAFYGQRTGFMSALIGWLGFKFAEVPVTHKERERGASRYDIFTQLNQCMSLFTGYASKPFQTVEIIGGGLMLAGGCLAFLSLMALIVPRSFDVIFIGVFLLISGLILGVLGIIGEYALRIYYEIKKTPKYLIEKTVD